MAELISGKVPSGQPKESTQDNAGVKKYPELQLAHWLNLINWLQLLIEDWQN